MSAPSQWAVTAYTVLRCDQCHTQWESPTGVVTGYTSVTDMARPAFALGWRVFSGARTQHTYCPEHGPTVPMRLAHPAVAR